MPAVSDADRLSRPGRCEPDGLLVPGVPAVGERSGATGRVSGRVIRSPNLHHTLRAFCLGAFAAVSRELGDGGDVPFSFEEHQAPGQPDAVRVPAAGQTLPRRARRSVRGAGGCPAGARRAGAGAGGGDLRPGTLERAAELPRGADPHRAPAAPRRDGGGLRRLRLGRLGLRPCVRGVRGLALRLAARVRRDRAARGPLGRRGCRSRRRAPRSPCRLGRACSALAAGGRVASGGVRARARSTVRRSSSRPSWATGRGPAPCPMRRASSRTRSRRSGSRRPARSRPARSSSSGSTGGPTGFVRCCRSRRRRRPASRRPARPGPWWEGTAASRAALGRGRRPRSRRGARPLGALALPDRPIRFGAAARLADVAAGRRRGACSPRRCVRLPFSVRRPASARRSSTGSGCWRQATPRPRPPISSGLRSSRCSSTATARRCSGRSTRRCSASGRSRPWRLSLPSRSAHSRHRRCTDTRARHEYVRRHGRGTRSSGSARAGSNPSTGRPPPPASCSTSCATCFERPRPGCVRSPIRREPSRRLPAAGKHWTLNRRRGCSWLRDPDNHESRGCAVRLFRHTESVQDSPVPGRTTGCVCA